LSSVIYATSFFTGNGCRRKMPMSVAAAQVPPRAVGTPMAVKVSAIS
jgi:hypothetical protein